MGISYPLLSQQTATHQFSVPWQLFCKLPCSAHVICDHSWAQRRNGNSLNYCYCSASKHLVILTGAENVPIWIRPSEDLNCTCWTSLVMKEALSSRHFFRINIFASSFFIVCFFKIKHLDWGILSSHFMNLCPCGWVSFWKCLRKKKFNCCVHQSGFFTLSQFFW